MDGDRPGYGALLEFTARDTLKLTMRLRFCKKGLGLNVIS
jgi:hypothetical protein